VVDGEFKGGGRVLEDQGEALELCEAVIFGFYASGEFDRGIFWY
jgi:hypothetical protein